MLHSTKFRGWTGHVAQGDIGIAEASGVAKGGPGWTCARPILSAHST